MPPAESSASKPITSDAVTYSKPLPQPLQPQAPAQAPNGVSGVRELRIGTSTSASPGAPIVPLLYRVPQEPAPPGAAAAAQPPASSTAGPVLYRIAAPTYTAGTYTKIVRTVSAGHAASGTATPTPVTVVRQAAAPAAPKAAQAATGSSFGPSQSAATTSFSVPSQSATATSLSPRLVEQPLQRIVVQQAAPLPSSSGPSLSLAASKQIPSGVAKPGSTVAALAAGAPSATLSPSSVSASRDRTGSGAALSPTCRKGRRLSTTASTPGSAATRDDSPLNWSDEAAIRVWPSIVRYLGNLISGKLEARGLDVTQEISKAVQELNKLPLELPLNTEWLSKVVAALWPILRSSLREMITKEVMPMVRSKLPHFLETIDINPCDLGAVPPKVVACDVLEKGTGNWIDLQFRLEYQGNADVNVIYKRFKAGVKNLRVSADFFMSFRRLIRKPPFFEGFSMYFCKPLDIGIEWNGFIANIDNAFLEDVIHKALTELLGKLMVLPNRIPVIISREGAIFDIIRPKPRGCLTITVLEASGLVGNDVNFTTLWTGQLTTDPFVVVNLGAESWRCRTIDQNTNPVWGEGNSHTFLIELPTKQLLDFHVFDDGVIQKLRRKAANEAEKDEIARVMGLTTLQILGISSEEELRQELTSKMELRLSSWWQGRDAAPVQRTTDANELPNDAALDEDKEDDAEPGASPNSLVQRTLEWAKGKKKRESSRKDRLQKADARLQIRARWRPVAFAYQTPPPPLIASSNGDSLAKQLDEFFAPATASPDTGGVQACEASEPLSSVAGDLKQMRLARQSSTRSTHSSGRVRSRSRSGISDDDGVTHSSFESGDDSSGEDSDDEEVLPEYVLRVGVSQLEQVPFTEHTTKKFFVICNVTPVVSAEGKEVAETVDDVTRKESKKRAPRNDLIQQRVLTADSDEQLAYKIGLLVRDKVPTNVIADVLGTDAEKVHRLQGEAMQEPSKWDVRVNETFCYFLRDPSQVTVELEVKAFAPKQPPQALGFRRFKLRKLLPKPDLAEIYERRQLRGEDSKGNAVRISVHFQLWPIVPQTIPRPNPKDFKRAPTFKADSHEKLDLPEGTSLEICVNHAKDLRNADHFWGMSDPYVVCLAQGQKLFQTAVIWDDMNPVWDHGPEWVDLPADADLCFEVYDSDPFRFKGDLLGQAKVQCKVCELGYEGELDLGKGCGTLHVSIRKADV